ncbi:MAG: hypothetical protein E6J11_16435 [Chloroflexi bacterium]|nr:MAG: hypothetical protein E6J11_16435 [Chloroflexota bacterium]
MSDTRLEQTEPKDPAQTGTGEAGEFHVEEKATSTPVAEPVPTAELEAKIAAPRQAQSRAGTIEHLAARRPVTPVDLTSTEIKERLSNLRTTITSVVTGYRWGNISLEDATEQIIPLLNVGSLTPRRR